MAANTNGSNGSTGSTQTTYIFVVRHLLNGEHVGSHKANIALDKGDIVSAMAKVNDDLKPFGFAIDKSRVTKTPFTFVFVNGLLEWHYRLVVNPKSRNYCAGCGCDNSERTPGCLICTQREAGPTEEDAMKEFDSVLAAL